MVNLNIYLVTFNCGRALIEPDVFGKHLLDGWQSPTSDGAKLPDVIVLNLQEIAPLSYAFVGGNLILPYFAHFRKAVQLAASQDDGDSTEPATQYTDVLAQNCGLTALMVFVRADLAPEIRAIAGAQIGVGVSETGNKGAVGARIGWHVPGSDTLAYTTFVSAHIAPFESEIERRNKDYVDIVKGLIFKQADARAWSSKQGSPEAVPLLVDDESSANVGGAADTGVYTNDSYLFFAGDLNYRTGLTTPAKEDIQLFPQPTDDEKSQKHYSHLLEKDQLTQERENGKTLHGLTEQPVRFPPTYKYHSSHDKPALLDSEVTEWKWAGHRWPSWCDRILFSCTPSLRVTAGKYSALPIFRTTDHRPVSLCVSIPRHPIEGSDFATRAPAAIDPSYSARRAAARRKEITVGMGAYLALTWEGNALVAGTICFFLGIAYLFKSVA